MSMLRQYRLLVFLSFISLLLLVRYSSKNDRLIYSSKVDIGVQSIENQVQIHSIVLNEAIEQKAKSKRTFSGAKKVEPPTSNASLFRRDYTCGPGNPCSNGACCGASGFCGYGELKT
jgi:hypothetical protein